MSQMDAVKMLNREYGADAWKEAFERALAGDTSEVRRFWFAVYSYYLYVPAMGDHLPQVTNAAGDQQDGAVFRPDMIRGAALFGMKH